MEKLLNIINNKFELTERGSYGFDNIKASGMRFVVNSYKAESLGFISIMTAKGFLGLIKMETLIINPTILDLPLLSYDRIHVFGKDKLILELYDTMNDKQSLDKITEVKNNYLGYVYESSNKEPHWYDDVRLPETVSFSGKKKNSAEFDVIAERLIEAYINTTAPVVTDAEAKAQKIDYYVNGLLNNGGPATDVFVKKLGKNITGMLFKNVLFPR